MNDQTSAIIIISIICILPIIFLIAAIAGIIYGGNQKKRVNRIIHERDSYKATLDSTGKMEAHELRQAIDDLAQKKAQSLAEMKSIYDLWEKKKEELNKQETAINNQIIDKKKEIIILDDEILLQSFGFYKPRYALQNVEAYKIKLDQIRTKQEAMVKAGQAASSISSWTLNNDRREGERMTKDYVKLILRSFNNECDASIINVKFNNVDVIERKLRKAFEVLNNLGHRMTISISTEYLNLKLQELYLVYEYQGMKQQEKEEQKRLREQMREDAKVAKEIEDMRLKIEKEEKHFSIALIEINNRIATATTKEDLQMLSGEKKNIELRMKEIEKDKQDVINRENNTRAGYVYIISNIGSFGDNIFKIGVTRRFDPTERVDELSDASVPFNFDIHATIFSDDAPALENALHKAFYHRRLNYINMRREFFNVTLDEIEEVVRHNFTKPIEVARLPDAEEYRQSMKIRDGFIKQG